MEDGGGGADIKGRSKFTVRLPEPLSAFLTSCGGSEVIKTEVKTSV